MAGAGAARPLVLPLPEVDAVTKGWTKRNNPWLLRAAAATKSTGRYRHNAAMLYLGRIRVYEMGAYAEPRAVPDVGQALDVAVEVLSDGRRHCCARRARGVGSNRVGGSRTDDLGDYLLLLIR